MCDHVYICPIMADMRKYLVYSAIMRSIFGNTTIWALFPNKFKHRFDCLFYLKGILAYDIETP